jgi:hypothetical protein
MAERGGFPAALILKAVGISLEKFTSLNGIENIKIGNLKGSRLYQKSKQVL